MDFFFDALLIGALKIYDKAKEAVSEHDQRTGPETSDNWIILDNLGKQSSSLSDPESQNLPDYDQMPEFHDIGGWE